MLNQLIRTMGGIQLNPQQLIKLNWLAKTRNVAPEQILSEIVEKYLGDAVPQFSTAERAKLEHEIKALAAKFNKPPNAVKNDILADKGHRYHLKDAEAKVYRDYLTLT